MRTLTLYLSSRPHVGPVEGKIQIESVRYRGALLESWARASYVSAEPADIIVPIAKETADNNYPAMRVVKITPTPTLRTMHVRLSQIESTIEADFAPSEMKPFMTPRYATQLIFETNLQQRFRS